MIIDFFKRFSAFSLVSLITGSISFVLLPILTKYLTPEDYGILSIFNALILFTTVVVSFGSVNVLMVKLAEGVEDVFLNLFKSFIYLVVFISSAFILGLFVFNLFRSTFFGVPVQYLFLVPVVAVLNSFYEVALNYYTLEKQISNYSKVALVKFSFEIGVTLILVIVFSLGWIGRISSLLLSILIVLSIPFYQFYQKGFFKGVLSSTALKNLLGDGGHLLLFSTSVIILNLSDRFFIEHLLGLEETGVYSIGYSVGSLELVLSSVLIAVFKPDIFKMAKNYRLNQKHLLKISIFNIVVLLAGVFFIYSTNDLIFKYLINERFVEAKSIVILIALSFLFWGMFNFYISFFIAKGYGGVISLISIFGILLNIVLNYFLIPNYLIKGAALATLATCALLMLVIVVLYYKLIVRESSFTNQY